MSVLSWNCRGLGNPVTVRDLNRLVKEKKPDLVFLMETKMNNKKCDFIRIKLGFDYSFCVDCVGRSGGLLLLWRNDLNVIIQTYSRRHISAIIDCNGVNSDWRFTGFYGHPITATRKESWDLLRHLHTFQPTPWLCTGDFNEIINLSEKRVLVSVPEDKWMIFDMLWRMLS
jgi:exonuclease III